MSNRILVIDDSEHLQSVLQLTLQFKGYQVEVASNGREGLDKARAAGFDLILCDIEMPVMNGIEFVRRYREEFNSATPIIMLTAEESEVANHALAAGATSVIIKPFEPIRLLETIEQQIS